MNSQNEQNKYSLSISTESIHSATSPDMHIGGTNISLIGGNKNELTKLILSCFESDNKQIAFFNIQMSLSNKLKLCVGTQDKSGKTLLHNIINNSPDERVAFALVGDVLKSCYDNKKYINVKENVNGNTALHSALVKNYQNVVKLLINSGADIKIKNKEGKFIELVTDAPKAPIKEQTPNVPSSIFAKQDEMPSCHKKDLDEGEEELDGKELEKISNYLDEILKQFRADAKAATTEQISFDMNSRDRDTASVHMYGGNKLSQTSDGAQTNDVLNIVLNEYKKNIEKQTGGRKNVLGTRKLVTYSEYSTGGASETHSESSDLSAMARAVQSKSTQFHTKALERIKDLLKLDESEARVYKAYIWNYVNDKFGEMSNHDRSAQLEKLSSDPAFLKGIKESDLKEVRSKVEVALAKKTSSDGTVTPTNDGEKKKEKKGKKESKNRKMSRSMKDSSTSSSSSSKSKSSSSSTDSNELNTISTL